MYLERLLIILNAVLQYLLLLNEDFTAHTGYLCMPVFDIYPLQEESVYYLNNEALKEIIY